MSFSGTRPGPRERRGGRPAFVVSVLLHAGLAVAILSVPYRGGANRPARPPELDAVAVGSDDGDGLCLRAAPPGRKSLPPAEAPVLKTVTPRPADLPAAEAAAPTLFGTAGDPPPGGGGSAFASQAPVTPGGGGGGGTASFFQVAAQGQTIVYVIDHSMSMGRGGLAAARQELRASLDRLPETARFQVVVYNRSAEALRLDGTTGLVPATAANKQQAARLLEDLPADGGTDHGPALKLALALRPDVIFFLTDADDLRAEQVREVTRINRERNAGRTAIHAIELNVEHQGREEMPLHVLARENRGEYRAVRLENG